MLTDLLAPLAAAAGNDQARATLFATLGHTDTVTANPALLTALQSAGALSTQIAALDASKLDSWAGVQQLISLGKQADTLISSLHQLASQPGLETVAAALAEELAGLLLASWLRRRHQTLFSVFAFFTLVKLRETLPLQPAVAVAGSTVRFGYLLDEFNFNRISDLISDPAAVLISTYMPNGMATAADAQQSADSLFPYLGFLADALGVSWQTHVTSAVPAPPATQEDDDEESSGPDSLNFDTSTLQADSVGDYVPPGPPDPVPDSYYAGYFPTFSFIPFQNDTTQLRIDLKCSSLLHPGNAAGLVLGFSGDFNQTVMQGACKLVFSSQGTVPALLFSPTGVKLALNDGALDDGMVKLEVDYVGTSGGSAPAYVFGSTSGTHLQIGAAGFAAGATWSGSSGIAATAGLSASHCSLVIAAGDGDGFLSSVLPSSGITANFDLGITWSSGSGFAFNGGAGLGTTLPVGLSLGGVLQIPSIYLGLSIGSSGLQSEFSASVSLAIGPIQATVSRLGILSTLALPASGGVPHFGDISFSFKPPSGVGLAINSAGVNGGGFLGFDPAKHQYTGVLQLQFNDLTLQAFGIITTQVAGSDGYSLLALVDANFPPVELGLGFTLNGVGGLLAVHRTSSEDALRTAMKAGTLSTILFPKNAITNAAQILAQLDSLFPTAPGRFLFGPMALIGWGTPTVLTASIAVILELPEPIEIIILGVLQARFPTLDAPLVKINMDAVGVIDFSQDELSLDATLFDSKLISFTLSGDMALRINWGSNSEFLLSIGGFHPQFTPPPAFPTLKRITIDMPSGIVSKLRLAAYLAVTSNSLQFGAALDVFIGVSGFGLSGHLGFDALLQLNPFHFEVDISGSIALTAGGDDLMSVSLDASLTGPAPWNIAGKFKIHIVFFDVHISFSQTWGLSAPSQQVSQVDVGGLLNTTLADPRSWNVQLPTGLSALVATRKVQDATAVCAHPLALVGVHERLVPLDLAITHFGQATPSGATQFSITKFQLGTSILNYDTVQDQFAPAQFFDLSDSDKLSRPSYELHDAGVVMKGTLVTNGKAVPKTTDYETYFIDTPGALRVDEGVPQPFPWGNILVVMQTGAAAQKAIGKAGNRRYTAPGNPITVAEPAFALVDTASLTPQATAPAGKTTYSDVHAQLASALATSPAKRDGLQIVATHELVAA